MKARHLSIAALAAFALSGCVTYDTVGARAPGGYYSGRASTEYYYGGYGYGGYGYYPYGYGGYYGSYGYPYPYYRPYYYGYPNHYPRPPHRPGGDGHDGHDGDSGGHDRGENRVPPWRRPGDLVEDAQRRDHPARLRNEERAILPRGNRQGIVSDQRPVPQRTQTAPQPRPMPRATGGESRSRPVPATGRGQYRGRVRSGGGER